MTLRRRKSKKDRAVDALGGLLKLETAGKAAKGAGKAAKASAAYKVAKRTSLVRTIPLVAGAAAAVFFAVRALRGGDDEEPADA